MRSSTQTIQIKITLIIIKRHLNLHPNLQKSQINHTSHRCRGNCHPSDVSVNLKRDEEEVKVDGEVEVKGVRGWDGSGRDFFEVGDGPL